MEGSTDARAALARELLAAVAAQIAVQNEGDARAVMRGIHSRSPVHDATRQALEQLYLNYRLRWELVDAAFVGADDRYGYVRTVQKTIRTDGPSFVDNLSDVLLVLAKEDEVWKLWTQAVLETRPCNPDVDCCS